MAVCICDGLHFYPKSISTNYELRSGIRVKRYGCLNLRGHSISTFNRMIYYGPQSDIRVKTFSSRNSPESSMLNFERRDRLLSLFGVPEEKLWPFVFAMGFIFILRASQYIISFNRESESNVMAVRICVVSPFFTFEGDDILWASIGHPSQNSSPSEFTRVFHVKF